MNCTSTDVDFLEGSPAIHKNQSEAPARYLLFTTLFDPHRRDAFVCECSTPFYTQSNTINQTHISLWVFFTHFHLVKWEKFFYNIHRYIRMINMIYFRHLIDHVKNSVSYTCRACCTPFSLKNIINAKIRWLESGDCNTLARTQISNTKFFYFKFWKHKFKGLVFVMPGEYFPLR